MNPIYPFLTAVMLIFTLIMSAYAITEVWNLERAVRYHEAVLINHSKALRTVLDGVFKTKPLNERKKK